jgi:hypothetical protein
MCIQNAERRLPVPMEKASLGHPQELRAKDLEPDQNFQSVAASVYLDS